MGLSDRGERGENMNTSPAYESTAEWVARFAYAAAATGIIANPFFSAFLVRRPATRKLGPPSVLSGRTSQNRPISFSGISRYA
jgi:hypothetical protein